MLGFMGAGKSSVGRALSQALGSEFEDLDERIELREKREVSQIFRESGEAGFRRAEHAALKEVLSELRSGGEKIVALGGGAFAQEENIRLIADAGIATVFLDAEVTELWRRCCEQAERQGIHRPLLSDLAGFQELYEARQPLYGKALVRQDTGGKTVNEIAAELIRKLGLKGKPQETKRGDKE